MRYSRGCDASDLCRNENYWLAFTLIAMDDWMATNPSPGAVEMTEMAKRAVKNKHQVPPTPAHADAESPGGTRETAMAGSIVQQQ